MSATNSSAAVARSQAKHRRSALDSLKRVLPERSAKLTAGLTIVIAMVLFAIIVPIFTKDPNKINTLACLRHLPSIGWALRSLARMFSLSLAILSVAL